MATKYTKDLLYHIENLALEAKAAGMSYQVGWLGAWTDRSLGGTALERQIKKAAKDLKINYDTYDFSVSGETPSNQAYRAWMQMWPASPVNGVVKGLTRSNSCNLKKAMKPTAGGCRVSPRRTGGIIGGASPRRYNARRTGGVSGAFTM